MVTINADTDALKLFSTRLRKTYPEVQKAMRAQIAAAGKLVAADARARTDSAKARKTIKSRVAGNVVTVSAGSAASPLPVLLENGGVEGTWRVPNFPPAGSHGQDAFVRGAHDQQAKPYLHPALAAQAETAKKMVVGAVMVAIDTVLEAT